MKRLWLTYMAIMAIPTMLFLIGACSHEAERLNPPSKWGELERARQ